MPYEPDGKTSVILKSRKLNAALCVVEYLYPEILMVFMKKIVRYNRAKEQNMKMSEHIQFKNIVIFL